jgi:hypothetical protein
MMHMMVRANCGHGVQAMVVKLYGQYFHARSDNRALLRVFRAPRHSGTHTRAKENRGADPH